MHRPSVRGAAHQAGQHAEKCTGLRLLNGPALAAPCSTQHRPVASSRFYGKAWLPLQVDTSQATARVTALITIAQLMVAIA